MRFTFADVLFYLIIVAIVYMLVRPGGQAGEALIAVTSAFAAVIAAAEGQTHAQQKASTG
jgi:hypothetical protein